MPPDDLFDDIAPQDPPAGTPAGGGEDDADAQAPPAAPNNLEAVLSQLAEGVQHLGGRLDGMEQRMSQPTQPNPAPVPNSDVLTELMNDPDKFFSSRVGGIVDGHLKQLVPFLETISDNATASARDRVRAGFETDLGAGTFDSLVGSDLDRALAELPPASRANSNTIQALTAGILGGRMMSEEGRKQVAEVVRKSRESRRTPAPELLTGGGRSPSPRDRVTDDERTAIESLRRSGIDFSEQAFLSAKKTGVTEEDWGSDWSKTERYWETDDNKDAASLNGSGGK